MDKRFDQIDTKLTELVELVAKHEKLMNQRVGNLPSAFQRVHQAIQTTTREQQLASQALQTLKSDLGDTYKHVDHVHDLVDDMRGKGLGNRDLLQHNQLLAAQLQQERLERRKHLSQLAESQAQVQTLLGEREQSLREIDRLRRELAELRLDNLSRKVAEDARQAFLGAVAPQPGLNAGFSFTNYSTQRKP